MNKNIFKLLKSLACIAVGFVSLQLRSDVLIIGKHTDYEYYGGDAFTGIQNAVADVSENLYDLGWILINGIRGFFLLAALLLFAFGLIGVIEAIVGESKSISSRKTAPKTTTDATEYRKANEESVFKNEMTSATTDTTEYQKVSEESVFKNEMTSATTDTTEYQKVSEESVFSGDPLFYMVEPNSAGGLQLVWAQKYTGSKEIKYYTICVAMYDSEDNLVADDIQDSVLNEFESDEPVSKGGYLLLYSDDDCPILYCNRCEKIQIRQILIEYTDGTKAAVDYGWYTERKKRDMSYIRNYMKGDTDFWNWMNGHEQN